MIYRYEWQDQALLLKDGQSIRIEHVCGNDKPLSIIRNGNHYNAKCFRCGSTDYFSQMPTREEVARELASIKSCDKHLEDSIELPMDRVYNIESWNIRNRVWLYKSGFSNSLIRSLGMFEHGRTKRIVMPVYNPEGKLVYWQARNNQKIDVPKYINPKVMKNFVAISGVKLDTPIVLVEDLLSMFKIGQGFRCISLLGTSLNRNIISYLIDYKKPVYIWLDPDDAGQKGALCYKKMLDSVGIINYNVISELDPKLYTQQQVKEILQCQKQS